jgi:hypothetical protein
MKNKYANFLLFLGTAYVAPVVVGIDYLLNKKKFPQGYMTLLGSTYTTIGLCINENARRE